MYAPVILLILYITNARAQFFDLFELPDRVPDDVREEYDFVIIGAGTAGSVVANRLSEEATWTVLLLEAGVEESFLTDVPIMAAVQSSTGYNWGYKSDTSDFSCLGMIDRRCALPRGKALGGTSVINFLLYTRGNKLDFDEWARSGNKGWSYEDVLPYFIKSENCSACSDDVDREYHGYQGNLHVQHPPFETPLVKHFLKAGEELGYSLSDPNGRKHIGFSRALATMENGRRCSAAKAFLSPIRSKRPNLHVVIKARVTKILINPETREAYAVEFLKNRKKHSVRIKKEAVLSAGTFNSPHLLMLSGVGSKEELERVGIPVVKESNVGFNLQDHVNFNPLVFLVNQSVTVSDLKLQNPVDVFNYVLNGDGPFTIPGGAEALAFVKTKNTSGDYPDVEIVLAAGGLHGDNYGSMRRCLGIPAGFYEAVYDSIRDKPGFSMSVVLMRPKSRGHVTLKDSNPLHWPIIKINYFQEEGDLDVMVEGIKKTLQIANTESFQKLGTKLHETSFPGCENLPFASDNYWKCALRTMATTLGHQVGTCKMGPKDDPEAVVDDQLRVHGIGKLRVVDGSIMPNVIAGHTNSVVMMIGEKASDLIKSAWK